MRRLIECLAVLLLALTPAAAVAETKQTDVPLDIPLPIDQEARTFRFPFYDSNGNLQMRFKIGIAKRLDEEYMRMTEATIETFSENGNRDLMIDLPESLLNLQTRIITSEGQVTIERSDFKLTGTGMEFDTRQREGKLTGNIRMLIYDRDQQVQ